MQTFIKNNYLGMIKPENIIKTVFFCAIFLGSFLLFLVQPMIAKTILPWFGGTSAVWITCILFFQLTLLGGYAYAHYINSKMNPKKMMILHISLLAISFFFLPILPSASWQMEGNINPTFYVVGLLITTIGLPFFLLSTTSPLLQAWYVRIFAKALPYRFFALSNLASLLGLLCYPFIIEIYLTLYQQSVNWSFVYAAFALLCAVVCFVSLRAGRKTAPESADSSAINNDDIDSPGLPPSLKERILWLLLAACSSLLLLSTTDHLSQNIAAVPLLWVLPLSLYLLSFILCFDRDKWYNQKIFFWIILAALFGMSYGLGSWSVGKDIRLVVLAYSSGLFLCCMFCHGELARRKPHPRYLTSFYLTISLGGALGSVFVVLIAPQIFSFYFELPLGLIFCAILLFLVNLRRWWVTDVIGIALIIRLLIIAIVYLQFYAYPEGIRTAVRNFYGHQRVIEYNKGTEREYRSLYHGTISHGVQFMSPEKRSWPVSYFGPASGVGLAIKQLPEKERRVGILGLGVGVIAAYARPGDTYKYYEINPQVEDIARNEFYYISESKGNIEIKLGDGRLLLERENSQQFDLLVIDAFSGNAVPMHLLTVEAVKLYLSHLKPDGILAFNVSNIFLDFAPVIDKAAKELGKYTLLVENQQDERKLIYSAEWVLVASNPAVLERPELKSTGRAIVPKPGLRLWTDDYSNIFQAFK